jgi:hypothetical protein
MASEKIILAVSLSLFGEVRCKDTFLGVRNVWRYWAVDAV